MMIQFEVPEWAIGKHLYFFAGVELLGKKEARVYHENGEHVTRYLPLVLKQENGRCTGCGSCCSEVGLPKSLLEDMITRINNPIGDKCPLVSDDGCIMKAWTPFSCLKSDCNSYDGCTEKLEVAE